MCPQLPPIILLGEQYRLLITVSLVGSKDALEYTKICHFQTRNKKIICAGITPGHQSWRPEKGRLIWALRCPTWSFDSVPPSLCARWHVRAVVCLCSRNPTSHRQPRQTTLLIRFSRSGPRREQCKFVGCRRRGPAYRTPFRDSVNRTQATWGGRIAHCEPQ